jgi:hypothetical protein
VAAGDTSAGAQKTQISSQALPRMASELQQLVGQFQFESAEPGQASQARKVPISNQALSPMIAAATAHAVAASQGRLTNPPILDF